MDSNYNNYKNKVIKKLFNKVTQIKVISIFIVKIKLKVMIINLVVILLKKNLQIKKIMMRRLIKTLVCLMK